MLIILSYSNKKFRHLNWLLFLKLIRKIYQRAISQIFTLMSCFFLFYKKICRKMRIGSKKPSWEKVLLRIFNNIFKKIIHSKWRFKKAWIPLKMSSKASSFLKKPQFFWKSLQNWSIFKSPTILLISFHFKKPRYLYKSYEFKKASISLIMIYVSLVIFIKASHF
jgi:hypothetical protein